MRKEIVEADLEDIYNRNIPWDKFENKTVLVTGAYGMLASYIVFELIYLNEIKKMHINIIAVGRSRDKFEKRFADMTNKNYLMFIESDLHNELKVNKKIDYIIHAASFASPQYYATSPIDVITPNIIGNYYLLELAYKNKVDGYLLFSSGAVYGWVERKEKIQEDDFGSLDTRDIASCYGESKRMAETMCMAWYRQREIPIKIARIFPTYAPTMNIESDTRVFTSFVKDIIRRKDIIMKSDGSAKREFCYIADAVAGFFLILLSGKNGEAYNVCNSHEFYSISEFAQILVNLYPEMKLNVVKMNDANCVKGSEVNNIPADSSKLEAIGWEIRFDVQSGFRRVIDSML